MYAFFLSYKNKNSFINQKIKIIFLLKRKNILGGHIYQFINKLTRYIYKTFKIFKNIFNSE